MRKRKRKGEKGRKKVQKEVVENKRLEKNRVRLFDYESIRKEMSFKVLELSCEALGTFDFPFPSFHANP